jgi:hypothetical protein
MELLKKTLTNCLLAFALISIGFAFGKHSVKQSEPAAGLPQGNGRFIAVYYLHSTFRCTTCNTIEKMTFELLANSYSEELSTGEIVWQACDFQENEALAEQFEVAASCVVVAEIEDGNVVDYKRLDEVWTLTDNPQGFNSYISNFINDYLQRL